MNKIILGLVSFLVVLIAYNFYLWLNVSQPENFSLTAVLIGRSLAILTDPFFYLGWFAVFSLTAFVSNSKFQQ